MKFIPYIKFVLLILCIVAFALGLASYDSDQPRVVTEGLNLLFSFSAVLTIVTVVAAIAMPLIGIFQNPKKALTSFVGIALVAVVFFIAYSLSSEEPITLASGKVLDSVAELKFADTSLYAMYISFAGVLVAMVGTEIYKIFK